MSFLPYGRAASFVRFSRLSMSFLRRRSVADSSCVIWCCGCISYTIACCTLCRFSLLASALGWILFRIFNVEACSIAWGKAQRRYSYSSATHKLVMVLIVTLLLYILSDAFLWSRPRLESFSLCERKSPFSNSDGYRCELRRRR